MSTYPAAEGLQVDESLASEQQGKILASPTILGLENLEKNNKFPGNGDKGTSGGYGEGMEVAPEETKRYCGMSSKKFWILIAILLVVIVAGAVGGGVGGSLARTAVDADSSNVSTHFGVLLETVNATILPTSPPSFTTSTSPSPSSGPITCPPTIKCSNLKCLGLNSPSNPRSGGRCLSGIFNQCPCISVCPASPKTCSSCNGSSKTLICGTGDFLDCTCTSECGPIDGPCVDCAGKSEPKVGGSGVCTSVGNRDCNCVSECGPVNGSCDLNVCFGSNGFCTQGRYWGCGCV